MSDAFKSVKIDTENHGGDNIKEKILVMSGKGGVGKSTFAANLALSLALKDKEVGLLDIDMHGPSIPRILGMLGEKVYGQEKAIVPTKYRKNFKVMSVGFFTEAEDAIIWRGPMKHNVIKQFINDVVWDNLDYMVIDSPPGTGDEPLSIAQLLGKGTKVIVVTTPQDLALADVRKSINFCKQMSLEVLGVVENMSGFVCPHCGTLTEIFKSGGGEKMAKEMNVPFLGKIPIDPKVVEYSDAGNPYIEAVRDSETAKALDKILSQFAV
ncbi:MAG: Mrp/NBP35 family ATP-binding protein [Spirochaetales bacterium]|nr:Mrp/NBP35 family ATP-binding protein [Spirochaetales bacterium]